MSASSHPDRMPDHASLHPSQTQHSPYPEPSPTPMPGARQSPVIAVLTSNILVGTGLRSILEKVVPQASVELFRSFAEYLAADPDRFIHCFVAGQLFAAHAPFFRERCHRTIVLTNGRPCLGMHSLDMRTDEEEFVHALVQMQRRVRRPEHALPDRAAASQCLSERETEVLTLVARGLINKEIADRLGIGLTTVISHRRNLMEKLGIRTVAGLVVYALTEGLVDPDEL